MRGVFIAGLLASCGCYLSKQVSAELQVVREAGYPATLAELNEWYPRVPPGENAADVFLDAFSRYAPAREGERVPLVGTGQLPPPGEPLSAEMKEAIGAYLAGNEEALRLLDKAAAIGRCRFSVDLTRGLEAELPHLSELRHGARLLRLQAVICAEKGEPEGAARSVLSILGLARSLAKEPILISHLVRLACVELALSTLERMLATTRFTDDQLARQSRAFSETEDSEALLRALAGERCMGSGVFKTVGPGLAPEVPSWFFRLYRASGLLDSDHLHYLHVMGEAIAGAELPLPMRLKANAGFDARVDDLPRYCILSRLLLPALGVATAVDARYAAWVRAAVAAIAVERYRLAEGRLPEKLADLVPKYLEAVPRDPFDGQPLRYRMRERGYVVYSVGENGKDDGGVKDGTSWLDVPFTVER